MPRMQAQRMHFAASQAVKVALNVTSKLSGYALNVQVLAEERSIPLHAKTSSLTQLYEESSAFTNTWSYVVQT